MNFAEEIEKNFPFFPRLHAIFASRPNVTPICITTALGPNGRSTVWYQPPDHLIDPQLLALSAQTAPAPSVPSEIPPANSQTPIATPSRVFGNDIKSIVNEAVPVSQPPPMTPGTENIKTRTPKASTFSNDILAKARASIQAVPKKRTLGETLMEIQRLAYFNKLYCCFLMRNAGRM
jgi:hypothetical protein